MDIKNSFQNFSILTKYNWIDRKKYLPVQIKYNIEQCTIFMLKMVKNMVKIEISPDFMMNQKIKYST